MARRRRPTSPYAREVRERIAANSRHARDQLVLTQEKAAELANMDVQTLQRLERATSRYSTDVAADLARAYHMDIAELSRPTTTPLVLPPPGRPRRPARADAQPAYASDGPGLKWHDKSKAAAVVTAAARARKAKPKSG